MGLFSRVCRKILRFQVQMSIIRPGFHVIHTCLTLTDDESFSANELSDPPFLLLSTPVRNP